MHSKLERMKETLMCAVEMQLCDLEGADTQELGEVIDMIKDLEEAIYYCTVTEAMKGDSAEMEFEMKKSDHHQDKNGDSRMYYGGPYMYADDGRRRRSDGTFYSDSGRRGGNGRNGNSSPSYNDGRGEMYYDGEGGMNYMDEPMHRDMREGRSYNSRRMYMEAKETKKDKAIQLRELEKYMQELSQDVVEMIADTSAEEKQYLEKKITALAQKVGQMK